MKHKEIFKSPWRTVELINIQANAPENITFAKKFFPAFKDGNQIWDVIKPLTQFKADPQTVDTIQGISTLFNDRTNIHGISGYGDCDCFVAALASIAIANKLPFEYIIQGNKKPSHIAIKIGETILDLTNPIPDYLRAYKFTKYIKPMYVALADNDEQAFELNDDGNLDFGRGRFNRAFQVAKRFNPAAVAIRTTAKYSPQAMALRAIQRQGNRVLRNPIVTRAGGSILRNLPPSGRAKIMLAKRQLKRRGFGDSTAELLAIENFADDLGRGRISLKRGVQNVGRFAKKAAPFVLPVAGAALNLIAPGVGGKVANVANRALQRVGGAKTLTAGRNLIGKLRPSNAIAPAVMPEIPTAGIDSPILPTALAPMSTPQFPADTYVLPPVPIQAPKINPLLLIGGGALALILLTRKK